jgi:hypothetical protein
MFSSKRASTADMIGHGCAKDGIKRSGIDKIDLAATAPWDIAAPRT